MEISYLGPFRDHTGYGEANRHAIAALAAAGVKIQAELVQYTHDVADYGSMGNLLTELEANKFDWHIRIIHTTPDQLRRYILPGKYNIAHFFWETSKLPFDFVEGLNLVNEIWTGSEHNRQAIVSSGVTAPVFVFPQAIETNRPKYEPYELDGFDGYLFYSIFEWIDRKNPEALLKAYYEEFQNGENVGLLLKTYFKNFSQSSKDVVTDAIRLIKRRMGLEKYPRIFLYKELLDRAQMGRIHATGQCYVSAHRGEGWGIPQAEAMLAGRPVITTNCGGIHEYLVNKETAILLPYQEVPVSGMSHSHGWYSGDQLWAEVDHQALRKAMRWAYENQKEAAALGERAREFVLERFNLPRVGQEMKERLEFLEINR